MTISAAIDNLVTALEGGGVKTYVNPLDFGAKSDYTAKVLIGNMESSKQFGRLKITQNIRIEFAINSPDTNVLAQTELLPALDTYLLNFRTLGGEANAMVLSPDGWEYDDTEGGKHINVFTRELEIHVYEN